ncbi:MAG TPA: hypothetical protein VJ828_08670 [Lacipirellulaceae bacterium]|nr:hypothetical protein [Lacipirellulaceae bacterium]
MFVCPECASSVDTAYSKRSHTTCPHCGADVGRAHDGSWIDVARVANLAEAGFLSDELIGMDIDAQIYQLEEFSALTDRWSTAYLIRVPSHLVHEAAAQIRQHLAEEAAETESGAMGFRFSADAESMDPLFWRPVALVVLAGVASFLLGQRFSDQHVDRGPTRGNLSTALGAIGRPLQTEPVPGQPCHRLSFDRRKQIWYLDTDRDSDGFFESRQQFQVTGTGW